MSNQQNRLEDLARIHGINLSDNVKAFALGLLQDCLSLCSDFMTTESDGTASECHEAIRQLFAIPTASYFPFKPQVQVQLNPGPRHHGAQLVSIPSGEYVGKASGNQVVVDGKFKFVVQTEDYVKGIDCPCTVIVDAGSNRYWVVYR